MHQLLICNITCPLRSWSLFPLLHQAGDRHQPHLRPCLNPVSCHHPNALCPRHPARYLMLILTPWPPQRLMCPILHQRRQPWRTAHGLLRCEGLCFGCLQLPLHSQSKSCCVLMPCSGKLMVWGGLGTRYEVWDICSRELTCCSPK